MTTQHFDVKKLREVAGKATPIYTDLLGDRYFNDDYSHATLNVQQDDFVSTFNPKTILALLDAYEASARDAEILRNAMKRLARAPGCGCSPVCRCGEGDWTRYELEGRMDDAQQALKDASHATQGD